MYQGRDAVNGYYVDIKEADADFEMWRGVNEKATDKTYMKVCDGGDGVGRLVCDISSWSLLFCGYRSRI